MLQEAKLEYNVQIIILNLPKKEKGIKSNIKQEWEKLVIKDISENLS